MRVFPSFCILALYSDVYRLALSDNLQENFQCFTLHCLFIIYFQWVHRICNAMFWGLLMTMSGLEFNFWPTCKFSQVVFGHCTSSAWTPFPCTIHQKLRLEGFVRLFTKIRLSIKIFKRATLTLICFLS